MALNETRPRVIQLYKTLLYMGRDYPKGYTWFRDRCHNAFWKNKDVTDPEQVQMLLKRGEFVVKEIEALYYLKKYRTMKHRYYEENVTEEELLRRLEKKADDGSL